LTGIALSGDVNLVPLHAESINEPLPEIVELIGDINLILDSGWARGETGASGLVNVDNIC
jgi:hypothetical protein